MACRGPELAIHGTSNTGLIVVEHGYRNNLFDLSVSLSLDLCQSNTLLNSKGGGVELRICG